MITLGHSYELTITRLLSAGAMVDAGDLGEILLPKKYCPEDTREGVTLRVFLYLDGEGRPIATTQKPKVAVGEFAYLEAIANTDYGTFMNWGLDKDLLVPFGEQHRPMEVGRSYIVHVYLSKADGRIVASSKIDKFLDDQRPHSFKPQQHVKLIIANSTDLGFKAIVDNSHWGVLYKNEVNERLSFGEYREAYIKTVRPDGKIDLTLQGGQETRDKYSQTIMDYLENHNDFAPVHDKSDPQLIQDLFSMSKKSFKKTIGGLYKKRLISIDPEGIRLIKP